MGTVSALKKQAKQHDQIREIFAGKAIGKLTAADLDAAIPQIEGLVATAKTELENIERKVKVDAAELLGTEGGLDKLRELSAQLVPLRTEYDALQLALDGARNARETAIAKEKQAAVDSARSAVEEVLITRTESALRIESALAVVAEEFPKMDDAARKVIAAADAKLHEAFGHGFKMEGNTAAGLRRETVQHEIELHLAQHTRGWQAGGLPYGVRSFSTMTAAWHNQILADFDMRFENLQTGKVG